MLSLGWNHTSTRRCSLRRRLLSLHHIMLKFEMLSRFQDILIVWLKSNSIKRLIRVQSYLAPAWHLLWPLSSAMGTITPYSAALSCHLRCSPTTSSTWTNRGYSSKWSQVLYLMLCGVLPLLFISLDVHVLYLDWRLVEYSTSKTCTEYTYTTFTIWGHMRWDLWMYVHVLTSQLSAWPRVS